MVAYGDRIQYSLFVCDLSDQELVLMRADVEARIKSSEDSVMVVDLGQSGDTARFLFIGQHDELPHGGTTIV